MTNSMGQEHRVAESISITPIEKVTGPSGKNLVTAVTWRPHTGHDEQVQRAEAELKILEQQEQERLARDPREIRLRGMEAAIQALNERLLKVEGQQ